MYFLRQGLGFPFQPVQPLEVLLCPAVEGPVQQEWLGRGAAASFSSPEAPRAPRVIGRGLCCHGCGSVAGRLPVGYVALVSSSETSGPVLCFQNQPGFSNTAMVFGGKNSVLMANLLGDVLTSNLAGWEDQVRVLIPSVGRDPSER